MKIIGLTSCNSDSSEFDSYQLYIKPDSALVVNNKPFFLPDYNEQYYAHYCLVAKINRLGKNISEKYASRYFDESTIGLNIINYSALKKESRDAWIEATAFDNSMITGKFIGDRIGHICLNKEQIELHECYQLLEKTISRVSKLITIRMGDMIAVDLNIPVKLLTKDDCITIENDNEILFCRIK